MAVGIQHNFARFEACLRFAEDKIAAADKKVVRIALVAFAVAFAVFEKDIVLVGDNIAVEACSGCFADNRCCFADCNLDKGSDLPLAGC